MNKPQLPSWKIAASLACLALLISLSSASAQLTITSTNQNGGGTNVLFPATFVPTWTVPQSSSVLNGLVPVAAGNFSLETQNGTRTPNTLTVNTNLTLYNFNTQTAGTTNYVTCGSSGGTSLIYTFPITTYGYNLTNIMVFGGWANSGRDQQCFAVYYSTASDPNNFIFLANVNYNPSIPANTPSANLDTINNASGGLIAAHVAKLKFLFAGNPVDGVENNYGGVCAITAGGSVAPGAVASALSITQTNKYGPSPFTPTGWATTPNLIASIAPSSSSGNFTLGGSGGTSVLTDGALGASGNLAGFATCGGGGGSGSSLIYTLATSGNGYDVTNIVTYSGWADGGRDGQYYTVSYSTLSAPDVFTPITTVYYLPSFPSGAPANQVSIALGDGSPMGGNVAKIKFDFAPKNAGGFNNGYQGYSEILVQGGVSAVPPRPILTQNTLPSYVETVVGDQVVFTASFTNNPPVNLQWLFISGGVTNLIPGATTSTLTLNNVQLTNSGDYQFQATYSPSFPGVGPSYSTRAPLVVGNIPAPVNNIILQYAGQTGQGGGLVFTPTWTVVTNGSLIAGMLPSDTNGNFALELTNRNISVLTDGGNGSLQIVTGDTTPFTTTSNYLSCGVSPAGQSVTYTLPSSPTYGYDVTNITVYGGWGDAGRNEQKYEVLYSSVANPALFTSLGTFNYNPTDPNNVQSATRTMLIPSGAVGSALAKNVSAVKINWNISPQPKNGWEGYSEIVVKGAPSVNNPILVQDILPARASTMVGDQIVFTAAYSNAPAANLQWQFINTNNVVTDIAGATGPTLTLNNLQLTHTGSYRLKAVNAGDALAIMYSTAAPLTVTAVPAPVNNIIVTTAQQGGLGPISGINVSTNFYPTWPINTANDLILGSVDGGLNSPGAVYAGGGNFAPLNSGCNGDPVIMSDGSYGYQNYYPGVGGNTTLDACGFAAGFSVTYTLPSSSVTGWSLTNLTVYGGFGNSSRDELKYEVLYSTISSPGVFNHLITVDYNPAGLPAIGQSATRQTLLPATGALVQNVYAVEILWYNAASQSENSWSGISEIIVAGQPSPPVPVLAADISPSTAEDVQGGSVTLTANFTGANSFQWQKDGTNVSGATSATLTLNNLQLSDMATNTGYRLVAINGSGTSISSACKVYVDPAPAAVSNVVTAIAYQTSPSAGFGPTWDTSLLTSSLIAGQNPPLISYDPTGNFNDPDVTPASQNLAGGLPVLTDGNYGIFDNTGPHPAFATCGPNAGQYVIYSLGGDPNGYNVTNIQIAGGWNDNGRDSQYYTVLYSTVANPTLFFPMVSVAKTLSGGNGRAVPPGAGSQTTIRATFTPASGVLASNVYAIEVDFQFPEGVPNGYSGYSEIDVFGSPSAALPSGPVITAQHEETNNVWTVEAPNLIANQLPSSFGPGVFSNEGCNVTNMTDGVLGFGFAYGASCGGDGTAVPWIIFTSASGWNLTNIVVYTLWSDYGRDGQFYNVSYSTLSNPTTFLPLASVAYNPFVPHDGRDSGNRVAIAPAIGQSMLATNVAAVKFDFTSQGAQDFGWSGYTEIVLQGTNLPSTVVVAPTITSTRASGGNLILTGAGGTPNAAYTWLRTTNLSAPVIWTTNSTGNLDGLGAFSNSIPMGANPASFFRLRLP